MQWFLFRPTGDDENPNYYVEISSPESMEHNAPEVRIEPEATSWIIGAALYDQTTNDGFLTINLKTDRSAWTRLSYILARLEVDKPAIYNRYFYIVLFLIYGALVIGFLWYVWRLLHNRQNGIMLPALFTAILLVMFVTRGIIYSSLFPAWQAPDEPAHFDMIRHISKNHALPSWDAEISQEVLESMERSDHPVIYRGGRPHADWQTWIEDPRATPIHDKRVWLIQASHPFLMYALFSIPLTLFANLDTLTQLYLLRLIMVCLSCAIIPIVLMTVRRIFPMNMDLQILIPSLLCFSSMYIYISSIVNNDGLSNLLSAIFIYVLLRMLIYEVLWRDVILGALVLGSSLLTKTVGLPLIPLVLVLWGLACWEYSDRWRITYRLCVMLFFAGCLGGWFYIRNLWLYGSLLPFGYAPRLPAAGMPSWSKGEINIDLGLTTPEQLGWKSIIPNSFWETTWEIFKSIVGDFGWGNVSLGFGMYVMATAIVGIACFGIVLGIIRRYRKQSIYFLLYQNKPSVFITTVCVLYVMIVIISYNAATVHFGFQGRYIFPVIVPIFCLMAWGYFNVLPSKYQRIGVWCLIFVVVVFDTFVLAETIIPRYYLIPPPSRLIPFIF
ncbi:MAG TPA: hypothetical protein DIT99_03860 [Candidatus Latescibacteria bacterium]|nr:hypothetical protein [Candidatus Latescibacterota bacterium]